MTGVVKGPPSQMGDNSELDPPETDGDALSSTIITPEFLTIFYSTIRCKNRFSLSSPTASRRVRHLA